MCCCWRREGKWWRDFADVVDEESADKEETLADAHEEQREYNADEGEDEENLTDAISYEEEESGDTGKDDQEKDDTYDVREDDEDKEEEELGEGLAFGGEVIDHGSDNREQVNKQYIF